MAPQEDVEKVLGDAASKANGLCSHGNAEQHLGHDDSLEPNFQAGQIPEEEVHIGVCRRVSSKVRLMMARFPETVTVGKQQDQETAT